MSQPPKEEDMTAEFRRELIRAANRAEYTAEEVSGLLSFAERTYPPEIVFHPSFPVGVLNAYVETQKSRVD